MSRRPPADALVVATDERAHAKAAGLVYVCDAEKDVAAVLGNTPAVCRASYIHPEVFLGWADGELHRRVAPVGSHQPRKLEALTLAFLRRRLRAGKRSP